MAACPQIMLVDDDVALLKLLTMRLCAAGYSVETAESGEQALSRLNMFHPKLVVTDLCMEGMDGMALYDAVHKRYPAIPVILITAHGTIPDAVDAIQRGVFDYLTKPFDSCALLKTMEAALRVSGCSTHRATEGGDDAWRSEIISQSPIMEVLLQQARLVADSDVSVFIQGESGTGKELLARAVHAASRRRGQPFIGINCTAIPDSLLESELFGHVKGAFSGASQNHRGLFQAADTGTIFLDEIGDMPLFFQAKLLRVLQEKEVRPVGSSQSFAVNVRIISATHRDIDALVATGQFREDLYYRLYVVALKLPSLAQRLEDIPLMAAHFLQATAERSSRDMKSFSPEAMELLVGAAWPGNIRQLQNIIEQVFALCTTSLIPADLVQRALKVPSVASLPFAGKRGQFERDYLVQLLRVTFGNVSQAARLAQRNRTEFYKLLHRHGLKPGEFRHP